jgi:hypothetical protein
MDSTPSTLSTHYGGCHCGAIRFEADGELGDLDSLKVGHFDGRNWEEQMKNR